MKRIFISVMVLVVFTVVNAPSAAPERFWYYWGVLCHTGINAYGEHAIECRKRFADNGYVMVMSRKSIILLRNGKVVLLKPNK